MKETIKKVLAGLLFAVIGAGIGFFISCGKSRSPLVKENIPLACKLILEGDYYTNGKSQVYAGIFGEACKGDFIWEYCLVDTKNRFSDKSEGTQRDKFEYCMAKRGK